MKTNYSGNEQGYLIKMVANYDLALKIYAMYQN